MGQESSKNIRISNDVYLELKEYSLLFNTSLSNALKILVHGFKEEKKKIEDAKKVIEDLKKRYSLDVSK